MICILLFLLNSVCWILCVLLFLLNSVRWASDLRYWQLFAVWCRHDMRLTVNGSSAEVLRAAAPVVFCFDGDCCCCCWFGSLLLIRFAAAAAFLLLLAWLCWHSCIRLSTVFMDISSSSDGFICCAWRCGISKSASLQRGYGIEETRIRLGHFFACQAGMKFNSFWRTCVRVALSCVLLM